jgi:hypothetical protein
LKENEVPDEDVAELEAALVAEPVAADRNYGPRVAGWIGKMMSKAADGTWQVGANTAGALLGTVLAKYYGLG